MLFYEILGAVALGLGAAGFAMALRGLSRGRLPRWIITVAAGIGMLGYSVYLDYTWGARQIEELPRGLTVVREVESARWWKPWTLVRPQLTRIAAVDAAGVLRNPAAPDLALTQLYVFDRHSPVGRAPVLIDCARGMMAEAGDGLDFGDDGVPQAARWDEMDPEDPIRAALCAARQGANG